MDADLADLAEDGVLIYDADHSNFKSDNPNDFSILLEQIAEKAGKRKIMVNSVATGAAFAKAQHWGDHIPLGIIYRHKKPTLDEQIPAISGSGRVSQKIDAVSVSGIFETFR